ncbi:hypothetical protein [Actinomadura atramentaria]|uniref:hypothetical protein n=1 Tax=Actinomadura atramentaria TaxID=1990 RepID=UPI00037C31C7|nr:hypothetical protein [Actinomadura atramentaria]
MDIPVPWDSTEFCARLSARRGREIRIMPALANTAALPCGLCVSTTSTDYIFSVEGMTPLHRDHILLHEVGHLLAGHDGPPVSDDTARRLLPDVDPALVRRVLGRTVYSTREEMDAEYFATLVLALR